MTPTPRRSNSRDKILAAATRLVAEGGVSQLTIEAAAAAAGVTKAGLIYHFKTRDELLTAVVEGMARAIDVYSRGADPARNAAAKASARPHPDALKSALLEQVDMAFDMPEPLQRLMRSLLQAHATHATVLQPVQALFDRAYGQMAQSGDPGRALLVSLAMDGLQLIDLLQLHTFAPEQRTAVKQAAQELIAQLP